MIARPCPARGRRRGATLLEFAVALPILLMLTLGMVVLGQGVSQSQMVALLAREGARYASVRGADYRAATGKATTTAADVVAGAITPRAVGFAAGSLTTTVAWSSPAQEVGSTVTVTVGYSYAPGSYLGTVPLASTAVMTISY